MEGLSTELVMAIQLCRRDGRCVAFHLPSLISKYGRGEATATLTGPYLSGLQTLLLPPRIRCVDVNSKGARTRIRKCLNVDMRAPIAINVGTHDSLYQGMGRSMSLENVSRVILGQ
jgi:hypothetical protein